MPEGTVSVTYDCCADGQKLLSLEEAWEQIDRLFACVAATEGLPLLNCLGKILAKPLVSPLNIPPFDNSAMDGYAYAASSVTKSNQGLLQLVSARLTAGTITAPPPLGTGEAVRIFTGAPLPLGADTVAMQEHCMATDETVKVPMDLKRGANCRPTGGDVVLGQKLLEKGVRLKPQDLALAAASGHDVLTVYRPLRVAVLSSGNELHEPGIELNPGGIYDSNRFGLLSLLKWLGCDVVDRGIVRDNPVDLMKAVQDAVDDADVIITSGGMSVGEEDHIKPVIASLGELAFWRINIKPGKPVGIAHVLGKPLIGLPGNPVSALVTFMLIARPLLLRLAGATDVNPTSFPVESAFEHTSRSGRREFLRGRLEHTSDGRVRVHKFRTDSSGVLSSMVETDGLIDMGGHTEIRIGENIPFMPFGMMR
ncbi:gephyrin-like molybdotransferase Glp [Magnetovibrio sp. PR-2]|uniref:molybdopterin molybdotransferase MoeA n=1 Tax=Magnetovibrio sp. PR-2 TaxID=3120356 RepID=UPI002FCDE531